MASLNQAIFVLQNNDLEQQATTLEIEAKDYDYSKRSQWLRAAVLCTNDGLVSTASLMMGMGAVKQDSMAIGEFVSVYSQLDIEVAQMKRKKERGSGRGREDEDVEEKESLPNPLQAAAASALAFGVGAMVPLLAASFIREHKVRIGVVVAAVSFALVVFGW